MDCLLTLRLLLYYDRCANYRASMHVGVLYGECVLLSPSTRRHSSVRSSSMEEIICVNVLTALPVHTLRSGFNTY